MSFITRLLTRGLAVGLPLILTLALIVWFLVTLESWLAVPLRWILGPVYLPSMGILVGIGLIIGIGIAASTWLGRKALDAINSVFENMPLVKTVYGAFRDALGMFAGSGDKNFDSAVVVEWGGQRFLGFITRDHSDNLPEGLMGENDVVVYLPMGYQIGGFPIVVARDKTTPLDMSVDAALKFAITAGASARASSEPMISKKS